MKFCTRLVTITIVTLAFGSCASNGRHVQGTVIDVSTKKPVSDAYVMAVYQEAGGIWFGHSAIWCVRTKGMFTGVDGRYQFPADGNGPDVVVIKPDYYQTRDASDIGTSTADTNAKQSSGVIRNLYLKPQEAAMPKFNHVPICERPKTKLDVMANIQFIKFAVAEVQKYGPNLNVEGLMSSIRDFESLPEQ